MADHSKLHSDYEKARLENLKRIYGEGDKGLNTITLSKTEHERYLAIESALIKAAKLMQEVGFNHDIKSLTAQVKEIQNIFSGQCARPSTKP